MNSLLLIATGFAGIILGIVFYGGLWYTVQKGLASKTPAFWFLGSFLLRMAITLLGFYFVSAGQWQRMLACLLGFVLARIITSRVTKLLKQIAQ